MSIAYIALGSNLGDKEANLRQALKMLLVKGLQIRSVSSFFKTEPYGVTDQPEFINAVACVKTDLAPEKLLKLLLDTELEMGRVRLRQYQFFTIIDQVIIQKQIQIYISFTPMPQSYPSHFQFSIQKQLQQLFRCQIRFFVLQPLSEIAADKIHPVYKKSIQTLLKSLTDGDE